MKAFVTGGTGFVGGHLIAALRALGVGVTALVRSPAKATAVEAAGVRAVQGDLSSQALLEREVAGSDVVFHVAGLIAARSDAEFLAVNRDGTARLAAAAAATGATRFVLVSSLAAGGPSTPEQPRAGEEPPNPVTRYGRSKLAAEAVLRSSGLAWTILRPPAVYGPGDREMYRLFRSAAAGLAPVLGDGSLRLSLVYGPDLGRAIAAAGVTDRTLYRVYYPAHPEIVSSRQLLEEVAQAIGRRVRIIPIPEPLARTALLLTGSAARLLQRATVLDPDKANEFFQPAWTCDPASLTAATGWTAEYDLAAGARAAAAWYRERGWL